MAKKNIDFEENLDLKKKKQRSRCKLWLKVQQKEIIEF